MASPAYTEQSLGKRGSVVITGATTGSFAIIVAGPAGATVSAITCTNKDNAAALITTLPAGYTSYGNFTAITVSAGSIEAYNA
jgi:NADPH:quinone reductase-like Zn-dependent oxidoreductase|tara:strand:+ start:812 stop:1060 length:249 start_codon:yes stop_codon:yes gene_type:complete